MIIVIPPPISLELARLRRRDLRAERRRIAERPPAIRFRRTVRP